ncbi:MAG: plsY [Acidobacteria bacterium]|nr:plsY [Acidobacteriota bacterium]
MSTALVAYALGSIPTAYLVGRFAGGVDLREAGEGNVGARNAFHEVGHRWGLVVFAVDIAKGAAVALLFRNSPLWQLAVAAFFLILGHAFPAWLGFVGGKGLACAGGFTIALFPWAALIGGAASGVVWLLTRRFLPTLITVTVATFVAAPFTGGGLPVIGVALGTFVLVALKRVVDEPRMRRIEARTGWDRVHGGSRA